jgi:hypothetical protein
MMEYVRTIYRWWLGAVLSGLVVVMLFPGVVLAQAQGGVGGTLANPLPVATQSPALPQYSGVQDSVKNFLCTPSDVPQGTDLIRCINRLYRFGLSLGGISLVFAIVLAGYVYMFQGQGGKAQAKSIVTSSFVGILILAFSYVLLRTINPQLTEFRPIQAPIFTATNLPSCDTVGLGVDCITASGQVRVGGDTGGGVAGCVTTEQGGCTKAVISACPAMAAQMDNALRACNQESMGGKVAIGSTTDRCDETTTGQKVIFSWGLWQLNLAAGSADQEFPECRGVLKQGTGPWTSLCIDGSTCGRKCSFGSGGKAAFDACVSAVSNPSRNTKQACNLFNTRGWKPWPYTRKVCKLP